MATMTGLLRAIWYAPPARLEDVLAWTSMVMIVVVIAAVFGIAGGRGEIPRGSLTWVFVALALVYLRSFVRNAYHRPLETWGVALHVHLVIAVAVFTVIGARNERRRRRATWP